MSVLMTQTLPNPLPVFHDRDCDLSIIRGKRIAVIGYGSQGRTHALNLRDSGVGDIVIGLKAGSATRAKAAADGFGVVTAAEAAAQADVVAVMVSDEGHRDLWRDELEPAMRPGAALIFAHGLSVRFGLVQPRSDLDVILASPKGIGPRIRDLYEEGQGVFCLFGEQVVLCGGTAELVDAAFSKLVDAGYPPEVAWFECFYELKLVVDLMHERGVAGAFGRISNTAELGAYDTGPCIIGEPARAAMDEVLANVRSGAFVERLMKDYDAGSPDLLTRRRALGQRRIEAVGAHLAKVGEAANDA